MRRMTRSIFFVFVCFGSGGAAWGQSTCTTCMQAVQVSVATCNRQLPPAVTPKNPDKPTNAERKAAKARAEAYSQCVTIANDGLLACRNSNACPK